ncbi:MAG TPA: helix-turn-helix domain-containing protein [Blastocatellia bacterium]|nr:helix-turn-helix domain-containing protein [Blastocatellia bacterium]
MSKESVKDKIEIQEKANYDRAEAASALGLSLPTIDRLIAREREVPGTGIPFIKPCRRTIFRGADLLSFLEKHRQGGVA